MECSCNVCQSACCKRPGWFLPGEVAKAAASMGIPPKEFFDKYVCVDFWAGTESKEKDIFLLAPATDKSTPGDNYPFDPHGRCRLYSEDGKCEIHSAKPHECAFYDHDTPYEAGQVKHKEVALAWNNETAQQEIRDYLGREPEAAQGTIMDMFSMFGNSLGVRF